MGRHIVISTSVDLVRVATEGVVYISSDGNYSTLIQADGGSRILTVQLGQLETLIARQLETDGNVFIRIGKSLIINCPFRRTDFQPHCLSVKGCVAPA